MRHDGRQPAQLRPIQMQRGFISSATGSVLIEAGRTRIICTASVSEEVPPWMAGQGTGWVTAEYSMLPASTNKRKARERGGKVDGRTTEIQRLIGRSLRAVVDFAALGERSILVDCDVIEADGGTRTASISGAFVAMVDAFRTLNLDRIPLTDSVAAVSVGVVDGVAVADLDYQEDSAAEVDMNVVMTGAEEFVEVQGTGEGGTFNRSQLMELLDLATAANTEVRSLQKEVLGKDWPFS